MITIQLNEFITMDDSDNALWSMRITDSYGSRERVMTLNELTDSLHRAMDAETESRINALEAIA